MLISFQWPWARVVLVTEATGELQDERVGVRHEHPHVLLEGWLEHLVVEVEAPHLRQLENCDAYKQRLFKLTRRLIFSTIASLCAVSRTILIVSVYGSRSALHIVLRDERAVAVASVVLQKLAVARVVQQLVEVFSGSVGRYLTQLRVFVKVGRHPRLLLELQHLRYLVHLGAHLQAQLEVA